MSVAIDNEISMNSIKDLEDDMGENLSHEIIGMGNGSIGIEEAFLAENSPAPEGPHSRTVQPSNEEVQEELQRAEEENNNNRYDSGDSLSAKPKKFITTTFNETPPAGQTKAFRFVNNSPNSMYKPKSRMKPTFRVETQPTPNDSRSHINNESVIIEQKFDNNGSDFETNDRKYVFQLNVKRPPGRPRKYPVDKPKAKRPQGRPRKYPVEVTGSTVSNSKITKKPTIKESTHNLPIDTELIATTSKRGRGRPKRDVKGLDAHGLDTDDTYGHERSFAMATAGATQSVSNPNNNHNNKPN